MRTSVGDLYIHKDIGDTYLVTSTDKDGIECINLDKGRTCSINYIAWRVFYRPLTHTQERTCR
jgi:hypothetical protein